MNEVWLADVDGAPPGSAPVIFKKLRSEFAKNSSTLEAFALRARRASHLRHDCIAEVHDVVVDRSECGFAMELIDGKTLRQLIATVGGVGNALPVWFAIHVARRICQALEHAHAGTDEHGQPLHVFHEHLNPENVFLTYSGLVKVTDFGLSQSSLLRSDGVGLGSMRAPASTAQWLAPAEAIGTIRNDLDGVGNILYELLTGICPNSAPSAEAPFVPPSQHAPWVNVEVDQLLSRILSATDPQRYRTATEVRTALDEYLSQRRHDVSATHIAGLVSVLFSSECRDSAPPTMRLQETDVQIALRRSRRTTPPDIESFDVRTLSNSLRATSPGIAFEIPPNAIPEPSQAAATADTSAADRLDAAREAGVSTAESTNANPFHHDWDLALKRAREEAQVGQRASGTHAIAAPTAKVEPQLDPLERAVIEFERGLECMRRNDLDGALKAWECALENDPQHRVCRANLNLLKKKLKPST
jgi:serine/threonine protein kinase